jgi:hypothetical protein
VVDAPVDAVIPSADVVVPKPHDRRENPRRRGRTDRDTQRTAPDAPLIDELPPPASPLIEDLPPPAPPKPTR